MNPSARENQLGSTSVLTTEQLESFQRDGFLVLSDFLDKDTVEQLSEVAKVLSNSGNPEAPFFSVQEKGALFNGGNSSSNSNLDTCSNSNSNSTKLFRDVALHSRLPRAAAELMQLDSSTQNVRVLRDVLLARGLQASSCDWHVDDQSFWPESYLSSASAASGKDQSGINVWIALDDMPMKYGGSMVVSSGSHQAPWRLEAYQVIGQNRTKDGGATKEQFAEGVHDRLRKGLPPFLTCAMSGLEQNENVSSMLEENRREFDLARGDIILSSRLTFHKTVDVTEAGLDFYNKQGIQSLDRYSIRYTPGSARLPLGWTTEWSMVSNPENAGRTLDEVAQFDGSLWYPQVWPEIKEGTDMLLDELATTILESSKQKAATESSSLRSLLTLSKS